MQTIGDLFALARDLYRPTSSMYWMYLASAGLMAAAVYYWRKAEHSDTSLRGYLFPRSVWLHRSALTDYVFAGITIPLWFLLISPYLLSSDTVAQKSAAAVIGWLGSSAAQTPNVAIAICYTAVLLIVDDFAKYWSHRWLHHSPLLWEFHKVHHSAEVLTPVTLYRVHPVESIVFGLVEAIMVGLVTGAFLVAFPDGLTTVTILGVNVGLFAFNLFGLHLRHSHIWLSFGRRVEHVFISPAQHQVHHSADPRHFDRNFGFQFAIWDWLFGSLYLASPRREVAAFGLGEEENRKLSSFLQLCLRPFAAAAQQLNPHRNAVAAPPARDTHEDIADTAFDPDT